MKREFWLQHNGEALLGVANTNTVRRYAQKMNLKGPAAVMMDLQPDLEASTPEELEDRVTFEYLDKVATFLLCALQEGGRKNGKQVTLTLDDVYCIMEENKDYFDKLMHAIQNDMPLEENPQKPRASRPPRKKK